MGGSVSVNNNRTSFITVDELKKVKLDNAEDVQNIINSKAFQVLPKKIQKDLYVCKKILATETSGNTIIKKPNNNKTKKPNNNNSKTKNNNSKTKNNKSKTKNNNSKAKNNNSKTKPKNNNSKTKPKNNNSKTTTKNNNNNNKKEPVGISA